MKFIHTLDNYIKLNPVLNEDYEGAGESNPASEINQSEIVKGVANTFTNGLSLDIDKQDISVGDDGTTRITLTIKDDGTDDVISLEDLADIIEASIDAAVVADEMETEQGDHEVTVDVAENDNVSDYEAEEEAFDEDEDDYDDTGVDEV